MNDFPRRNQMDKCFPPELKIDDAIRSVDEAGADPKLTDAIIKLQEARELVSDWFDNK